MFTYPKTDLDTAEKVRSLLGGYWTEAYEGRDQIANIVDARIQLWNDAVNAWDDAVKRDRKSTRLNSSHT